MKPDRTEYLGTDVIEIGRYHARRMSFKKDGEWSIYDANGACMKVVPTRDDAIALLRQTSPSVADPKAIAVEGEP